MANRTIIQARLTFYQDAYKELQTAYVALIGGGVQSYRIDDRQLTRFDTDKLLEEMKDVESTIDTLTAALEGKAPRKAFGIIPRDW